MSQYDPKKIEEYQLVLLKNPRSPVFAVLAEAYRKMGLLDEALEISQKGVKHNPEFVSGLVAHAKVLFELKDYRLAVKILQKAHLLKPENLLALRLLGLSHVKLKNHVEALKCFKKLMILNPNDQDAITFVQKWEFLEHLPSENHRPQIEMDDIDQWVHRLPAPEQAVHLIDTFLNYGDNDVALEITNSANLVWPNHPEIKQRQNILLSQNTERKADNEKRAWVQLQLRKEFYQNLLRRIEQRKTVDPTW